ncbi:MAG: TIGR00730 family Rossman fold protein [Bacteroidaceae bacterium]|nr:TIGR00730 family Rossman fold protein [Bacteroidaceae bacterium]
MNKIGIFCASSNNMDAIYYEEARKLGEWIGKNNKTLVYGGANCGLMEAVAKAVHENGGTVYGIVPQILAQNNRVSEYIDINFRCEDLNDRKQFLESESEVIVVMPGSIGTLDEMFTVMAANTIGINDKKLILWNINNFWDGLLTFFHDLEEKKVVNKPFCQLMKVVNSFEELIENL